MTKLSRRCLGLALLLAVAAPISLSAWSRLSGGPGGLRDGSLAPCPDRPNCVCSQETDPLHAIQPIPCEGDPGDAMARMASVLASMPGCEVLVAEEGYLHARFATRLLRFLDDVEVRPDPGAGVLHVRSASRVGHSDLGANRARVDAIRAAYLAADRFAEPLPREASVGARD